MKNNAITISSGSIQNPELEELIRVRDNELKELSRKNAKHFAKQNLPAPIGDSLQHYVGEIKTGYDKLGSEVLQRLQPEANFDEAKMDADYFKEKDKTLENEIKIRVDKINHAEYEMGNFNHGNIIKRLMSAGGLTLIITIGEIVFNTKAFQVIGDNLLFSLMISIAVSTGILAFAHFATFLYKGAKSVLHKRLIVFGSLLLVTIVFYIIAIFRSQYLASQNIHISPSYFVIFNLFFFIVTALISFFILPSWLEIKENARHLISLNRIKRLKKEIEQLKNQRAEIKDTILK